MPVSQKLARFASAHQRMVSSGLGDLEPQAASEGNEGT